jgi:hypothetical protein
MPSPFITAQLSLSRAKPPREKSVRGLPKTPSTSLPLIANTVRSPPHPLLSSVNTFFAMMIGAFSLMQLAPNVQALAAVLAPAASIFAMIEQEPRIDSASEAGLKPDGIEGVIELEEVNFLYPLRPAVQVLRKFSAIFPRARTTAVSFQY